MAATHSPTTPAELRAPKTASGPRGRPLLGNLLEFRWNNLDFVVQVGRDYGDVARFRLANRPMYQVNHPDGIKHVLQDNHRNYNRDNISFTLLKPALGNGLLVTDGDFWLRQRRLMQPAFHRQRIATFGSLMVDAAVALLGRWEPIAARRTAVNVADEMMAVTLSIATKTLFSTDISAEVEVVRRATAVITEDFMFRLSTPFYPSLNVPTLRNRRFAATMREIDRVVYGIIAERRRSGADPGDLLSMLMEARDEESGAAMDDRQLRDEVITLLMAGHETTAVAMTWVWYLLSKHPAVQQRLHQELAEVLGGRTPTLDDLPKLKYTRMVIDETMRLYPPAYYSSRNAVQDDEICGYHIPAGAFVGISPYVIHRQPALWENPEGFDPERFTPERAANRPRFAYIPFLAGPHQCIGNTFALVEAQLILATVAQRYRLELVPGHRVEAVPAVTLRPRDGVWMTLHVRD